MKLEEMEPVAFEIVSKIAKKQGYELDQKLGTHYFNLKFISDCKHKPTIRFEHTMAGKFEVNLVMYLVEGTDRKTPDHAYDLLKLANYINSHDKNTLIVGMIPDFWYEGFAKKLVSLEGTKKKAEIDIAEAIEEVVSFGKNVTPIFEKILDGASFDDIKDETYNAINDSYWERKR